MYSRYVEEARVLENEFIAFLQDVGEISELQQIALRNDLDELREQNEECTLYHAIKKRVYVHGSNMPKLLADKFNGISYDVSTVRLDARIKEIDIQEARENGLFPVVVDLNGKSRQGFLIVDPFNPMVEYLIRYKWRRLFPGQIISVFCSELQMEKFINYNSATLLGTGTASQNDVEIYLRDMLRNAIRYRASDIRVCVHEEQFGKIVFRIDGYLTQYAVMDKTFIQRLIDIVSSDKFTEVNDTNTKSPRQGEMKIEIDGEIRELRVNFIPTLHGIDLNLRFMYAQNFKLDSLGATEERTRLIRRLCDLNSGLILLCGATGSGKSSTAYAMLEELKDKYTICTAEDPVEHKVPGLVQVEVDENLTYAKAIASFLRHDPDVIFIGEIRDEDTAKAAIRATLTGHLVISSLHTTSAAGAISRLRDLGISNSDISECLRAVIFQNLVGRVCPACKKMRHVSRFDLAGLFGEGIDLSDFGNGDELLVTDAPGCDECNNTGVVGRCLVTEILEIDNDIRDMIVYGESAYGIQQAASSKVYHTKQEVMLSQLQLGMIPLRVVKETLEVV